MLVVGADGRHSTVRAGPGLTVDDIGAPMDVLWMRLSRHANDGAETLGRDRGRPDLHHDQPRRLLAVRLRHPEGRHRRSRAARACRRSASESCSLRRCCTTASANSQSWDDIKLLTVAVDRLPRWYRPGLLCIGDAAHAMSPIGGVGINLAIQDAVAAANILAEPLRQAQCDGRGPACRSAAARTADAADAAHAGAGAEPDHQQRAQEQRKAQGAVAGQAI